MTKTREIILTALVVALLILGFVLSFYLGIYYWEYVRPPCQCPGLRQPNDWEPFSINYESGNDA